MKDKEKGGATEDLQPQERVCWVKRKRKLLVSCAVAVTLLLCVLIPLYKRMTAPPMSYTYKEKDMSYQGVEIPALYFEDGDWDLLYFDKAAKLQTRIALITKTGERGYVEQNILYTAGKDFDKVIFRGVVKKNSEFAFEKDYDLLEKYFLIGRTKIEYKTVTIEATEETQVIAKFIYQEKEYYLDIITRKDPPKQLRSYVEKLLA